MLAISLVEHDQVYSLSPTVFSIRPLSINRPRDKINKTSHLGPANKFAAVSSRVFIKKHYEHCKVDPFPFSFVFRGLCRLLAKSQQVLFR